MLPTGGTWVWRSALVLALMLAAVPVEADAQGIDTLASRSGARVRASLIGGFGLGFTREYFMRSGPPRYDTLFPGHSNELATIGMVGVELERGRLWGGTRVYSAETELLSDNRPNPLGFAFYGGVQQQTPVGKLRAAAGVDAARVGPFGVLAIDWFAAKRFGVGLEGFGVAGSEPAYGALVRFRLRIAP